MKGTHSPLNTSQLSWHKVISYFQHEPSVTNPQGFFRRKGRWFVLVLGTLLPRLVQAREDGLWARGTAMKELSTG